MTLGLHEHRGRDCTGISWSMPLSHLRFYGGAVPSHRTVGFKNSKVSFDQIIQVAMGSTMSSWNLSLMKLDCALRFFIAFADILDYAIPRREKQKLRWPRVLADQASKIKMSDQTERQEITRLVGLGWRRYGTFLAAQHPPAYFGLTEPNECMGFLRLPDPAISTMRSMAEYLPVNLQGAITRYIHPEYNGYRMIEYATVFTESGAKTRWVVMPQNWNDPECISMVLDRATTIRNSLLEPGELFAEIGQYHDGEELFMEYDHYNNDNRWPRIISKGTSKRLGFWEDLRLRCIGDSQKRVAVKALKQDYDEYFDSVDSNYRENHCEHFLGNMDGQIHLYILRQPLSDPLNIKLPMEFVTEALESQIAELPHTDTHGDWPRLNCEVTNNEGSLPSYYQSLTALGAAREVFARLPNAEVDLAVVSRPLGQSKWAAGISPPSNIFISRATAIACICMFESGELDLQPEDLDDVIAVSSSNNLYASEILFCDPSEDPPAHALRHMIGNVGRPGLVLLLSPRNTMLREPDLGSWKMVNHAPFDGKFENNFESTSLHLSLTGWEQPVNVRDHGDRDSVVHFVEAVVSAHDRGVWHADLDLLCLSTRRWPRILHTDCPHTDDQTEDSSLITDYTAIDNWYEVIDQPRNPAILRCRDNWIARLALAAIPISEAQHLVIVSDKPCCACLDFYRKHLAGSDNDIIFLC